MKNLIQVSVVVGVFAGLVGCGNRNEAHCRQALREMNEFTASLQRTMGGTRTAAPEEPFMTRCRALSPAAAQCAIMSYSMSHQAECAQHRDALRSTR